TGVAAGFQFFDDTLPAGSEERPGHATRESLNGWLQQRRGRNVFGLLHVFEPHSPYEPPAAKVKPRSAYDGEVTTADGVLGAFLDDLERRGLYRDALIFVLSDHGEGLGDHGEDEHGVFLYREAIQVPLLVKLPGNRRAGDTVSRPVGLVDVVPTIFAVLEVSPGIALDGHSLLEPAPTPPRIYSETFFPRLHLGWSESFSIVDDEYHFIDAPRSELYRYRTDRVERANVIAEERRIAASMREQLTAMDRTLTPPSAVTDEERRSLAALGYLGSAAPADGTLPDAKDRVLMLRSLKNGYAAFQAGEFTRAAALLRTLTREAPELVDGWTLLAEAQLQLGQSGNAIATLRSAATRFPTHSEIRARLGALLLRSGDLQRAATELTAAAEHATTPIRSLHYNLAEALSGTGKPAEAEAALRREVELFPDHMEAWGGLAAVLAGRGRLDQAREVLRLALQRNPTDRARRIARDTLVAAGDREGLRLLGLH
ncbi:MAG TPA: sulfatase-like hydrolase/transferase, partial [Thermoanaerobaculia bacterium]|nr:sulfatase-like hydrolase/transferase [Thermoanaerobaculia bacterium]